jgi:uncharacterized RDD family membrane protein YckC
LGAFADKLVVLRPAGREAEVALFSPLAGGAPAQDFQRVPLFGTAAEPPGARRFWDLIATLAVAAMLLLVFWRRQGAVMVPAELPAGVEIARPSRRIAAAVLDMLPAGIVVTVLWHGPIQEFADVFWPAFMSGRSEMLERIPWPVTLTWAGVCFRVLYTLYCLTFELIRHATPGKWATGCWVCTETCKQAGRRSIVIRNVTKLIELEPSLQIWPFVLVLFFTRNHQRLGDLFARTLVVQATPEHTGITNEREQ